MFETILFSILRCALWGGNSEIKEQIKPEVWKEIMDVANRQSVTGIITDYRLNNMVDVGSNEKMKLLSCLLSRERQNLLINKELTEFTAFLLKNEIKFCVVKG